MRLRRLKLENIRSYTAQEVLFGDGITLLAGDIGSGKTTLLLAVEFALFGIRRGELSGDALLRHGEKSGSVELEFIIDDYRLVVRRNLKRHSSGVRQDDGFLEIDGKREELTAQELKARIIGILGYPEELITKSKGLIFRYTVYTPQEEMKKILFESDNQRLNSLRAAFGIDKYKTVLENTSLLLSSLREKERFIDGQLKGLAEQDLQEDALQKQLDELSDSTKLAAKDVESAKLAVAAHQEQHQALLQQKEKLSSFNAKMEGLKSTKQSLLDEQARLKVQLEQSLADEPEPVENPSSALQKVSDMMRKYESKHSQLQAELNQLNQQVQSLDRQLASVDQLTHCPTCKQEVGSDHKKHLRDEQSSQRSELQASINLIKQKLAKVDSGLVKIKAKSQLLSEKQSKYQSYLLQKQRQLQQLENKKQAKQRLEQVGSNLKQVSQSLLAKPPSFDQEAYDNSSKTHQQLQSKLQVASVEHAKLKERHSNTANQLSQAKKLADKKAMLQEQASSVSSKRQWLQQLFEPLVTQIEQQVLASIHAEFSMRFTDWFMRIVEDESMFASLSNTFSPLVTQDGYDVDVAHLSGGEKTAVALAYRLALTTVLNNHVRSVKTDDLLILDEPTDGFSTQQLDRVRDVLVQLPMKQIILVSHEPKMATFADQVVSIEKRDHHSVAL